MPIDDVDAGTQLETPDTDVEVTLEEGSNSTDPAKPEEPFLSVNDRQSYKTKDDAIRAYDEAGKRIAQLSAWEKRHKEYGIGSPDEAAKLYDELISLRQEKANAAAQAGKKAETPSDSPEYSKEEQDVIKLLKKLSPAAKEALGYTSKADFEKSQEELKALKEWRETQEQARTQDTEVQYQSRIETSEQKVSQWMKDSSIDDPDGMKMKSIVGPLVREYINQDEERIQQWNRGGVSMDKVLKDASDAVIKALGWSGNSAKPATVSSASAAASKGKQLVSNKTLPSPGDAKGKAVPKKANAPDKDTNDKAWDEFQAALKR